MHPSPAFLSPGLGPTARAVLDVVRRRGGASRAEIAEAIGVSFQAATQQTAALETQGLLESSVQPEGRRGPPAARYRIVAAGAFGIGVQLARLRISAAAIDLDGRVVAEVSEAVRYPAPEEAFAVAARLARAATAAPGLDAGRVLGVGVALPAAVRRIDGALVPPRSLAHWTGFDLEAARRALGGEALVENNANAAALGETTFADPSSPGSTLYLYIGSGIGAGLARWLGDEEAAGLDDAAMAARMALDSGAFAGWLARAVDALAPVVAAMTATVDVARVVVGGSASAALRAALRDVLAERLAATTSPTRTAPRLEIGRHGVRAALVGAASLPIAHALGWEAEADPLRLSWSRRR